ncbi:MAG: LolA family protein [Bilophila wadsworthia]
MDKGTKLIKKAQILDFYGNTNEVALTSLTPDASIKAGTFQFTPPQGITVENLMNQDAPNARCCNNALALRGVHVHRLPDA